MFKGALLGSKGQRQANLYSSRIRGPKNVFEEFTQAESSTSKDYGGTGLGLPISKKMTEMMGGQIDAVSEVGKGTTFTITIPISVKN